MVYVYVCDFSVQIHCKTAVQLPSHSKITHVNMWVLLCGVFIGCRWENSANFSLESFSYLQIDKESNIKRHSNSCKILKLLLYTIFFPYKTYLAVSHTVQGKNQKTLKKERQVFKISLFFIFDSSNISEVNEVNKDNIKAETIFLSLFFFIISFNLLCILIIIVAKVIWPYWNSLTVYYLWTLYMDIFINEIIGLNTYLSRIKDGKNVVESFV